MISGKPQKSSSLNGRAIMSRSFCTFFLLVSRFLMSGMWKCMSPLYELGKMWKLSQDVEIEPSELIEQVVEIEPAVFF